MVAAIPQDMATVLALFYRLERLLMHELRLLNFLTEENPDPINSRVSCIRVPKNT